jgi:hypothetical protein
LFFSFWIIIFGIPFDRTTSNIFGQFSSISKMRYSLTTALLAVAAYAAPAEEILSKRATFKISAHPKNVTTNGALSMMRTHAKFARHYGSVAPADVKAAALTAVQSGSVT